MIDITEVIFKYRNCIRELWNNYYIDRIAESKHLEEDLSMYYNLIRESLFVSLVTSRVFSEEVKPTPEEYYDEIDVYPALGPEGFRAMYAKLEDENYNWDFIWLKTENNLFKYIEFFDWSDEQVMDCQYVKAKLIESEEFPEFIGYEFLFEAASVSYLIEQK